MRIVVGVDGSDGSAAALQWAVDEAHARGCPVVALLAYGFYGRPQKVQERTDGWDEKALGQAATDVLHETVSAVTGGPRGGAADPVTTMVAELEPVEALLEVATGDDDVLVVGSRGLGAVKRLLLGSVGSACARHASGPVVVVRPPVALDQVRPVVVGVDGSPGSLAALDWAIAHAAARRLPLHVVRAWSTPPDVSVRMADILAAAGRREETEKELHELVERRTRGLDGRVTTELVDGYPAPTLLEAASGAELLVLGFRGSGGFAALLLGSVSATCTDHASTSVALIHPTTEPGGAAA
ncbi:MAG TPA: universal stress protein [Frankiaceae bacterium]|nr:universal stress protein [Frankiaceae bacterium]